MRFFRVWIFYKHADQEMKRAIYLLELICSAVADVPTKEERRNILALPTQLQE
uniref:Uncharacterized protein n=1 Tax=Mesocestoides corti TaxID=53468 RepID=A0A5K3FIY2_MESCO